MKNNIKDLINKLYFYSNELSLNYFQEKFNDNDINYQDDNGNTILMYAIMVNRTDIANFLLTFKNINLSLTNFEYNETPLIQISFFNNFNLNIAFQILNKTEYKYTNNINKNGLTTLDKAIFSYINYFDELSDSEQDNFKLWIKILLIKNISINKNTIKLIENSHFKNMESFKNRIINE